MRAAAGQSASIFMGSGTAYPTQGPGRSRPVLTLVVTQAAAAAWQRHDKEAYR
jgi:hypothetical protein